MSEPWDLLVIGAGPGGYPAAIRGAQLGLRTACVERDLLGGVCLNWGCIPSKALLKTAELAESIRHAGDFGLTVGEPEIDWSKVIARSRGIAKRFNKGVAGLFKKYGVTQLTGHARLLGEGKVQITNAEGEATTHTAKHILVATGARARTFPGIEPDGERILTYREAIVLDAQPPSIVILGAGAIGMEFASFLAAMGTEVTVVEGQAEVLPVEDPDCAAVVRKAFAKRGVTFKLGARVSGVTRSGDGCEVTLEGEEAPLKAHTVLAALGIAPNTGDVGLEDAGVRTDGRGFIEVDPSFHTSAKGVYAIGDVCSRGAALAHVAIRQAHVCVERIAGHHVLDVDDTASPSCTYCQPQVASVGLTEAKAKDAGHPFTVGRFPFAANGRAQGAGKPEGFVKVLVHEDTGEILGAHIVGQDATELIAELTLARAAELDADTLITTIHAHPTASEAVLEALAEALGVSVHI